MISELLFVTYIRMLFGYCHVTIPYREILSFFGRFAQKVIVSCFFPDSFYQFLSQYKGASADGKMAAIMLQSIPSFYAKISKKVFLFLQLHLKKKTFL